MLEQIEYLAVDDEFNWCLGISKAMWSAAIAWADVQGLIGRVDENVVDGNRKLFREMKAKLFDAPNVDKSRVIKSNKKFYNKVATPDIANDQKVASTNLLNISEQSESKSATRSFASKYPYFIFWREASLCAISFNSKNSRIIELFKSKYDI